MRPFIDLKQQLNHCKKSLYLALGIIMVACGIIGIMLPVMPTTIFFIIALACFSRSSSRMKHWLLNHPKFGSNLTAWTQYQIVPIKAKYWATASMVASVVIVALTTQSTPLTLLVAYSILLVIVYLLSKPSSIETAIRTQQKPALFTPWKATICSVIFLSLLFINCPYLVQNIS
ncbi:MAG: YbaN family protein [Gammaproteobacteria bacterium]|nr:YbaN family protein [Gammaproteobacteria bacterium]